MYMRQLYFNTLFGIFKTTTTSILFIHNLILAKEKQSFSLSFCPINLNNMREDQFVLLIVFVPN